MAFNDIVNRDDAGALIPEDAAQEILKAVPEQSAALSLFRNTRMSRKQQRLPVMNVLPTAYFVNGDTGLKQTTKASWKNVFLNAEPIACIVPVPEDVIDDADFDIWGETKPLMAEAIGRALDAAIFFGTNKPASWPTAIVPAASANPPNNVVTRGTATQANGGVAQDINQLMGKVEAAGYDVNGFVADRTIKGALRGARATDGQKLLDVSTTEIEGAPVKYALDGMWPTEASSAEVIAGDFSQGIIATRSDISWKILDQSAIFDDDGNVIYNLPQQDMVAMRVVARFAFAVPNPTSRRQGDESKRYPFGVLRRPA